MHFSKYNLIFDANEPNQHVILNPMSGSMDRFNADAVELLNKHEDPRAIDSFPDFFRYCQERGYLFQSASDEKKKLNEVEEESSEFYINEPLKIAIYVTFLCNLRCTYCFENSDYHSKTGVVQPEVIDNMFNAISKLQELRKIRGANNDKTVVTLFGGEPLLKRKEQLQAIKKILNLCKLNGYQVAIDTNGVHLGFYAKLLSQYNIDFIQVTLDGPEDIHDKRRIFADGSGSFLYIVESIDQALDEGLIINLRINVDEMNIMHLPDLADFIIQKGWLNKGVKVGINPVNEFGSEHECCLNQGGINTHKKLFEIMDEHPKTSFMSISTRLVRYFENIVDREGIPLPQTKYCSATVGSQFCLDLNGNIFNCCCMGCCNMENFRLGRFHPTFELNEDVLNNWTNRNILNLSSCKDCSLALICGGGCSRLVLNHIGDLKSEVVCPPMLNMDNLQILLDHYLPLILKNGALNYDKTSYNRRN